MTTIERLRELEREVELAAADDAIPGVTYRIRRLAYRDAAVEALPALLDVAEAAEDHVCELEERGRGKCDLCAALKRLGAVKL